MTPLIVVLMLAAAVLHSSWHVMVKSNKDRLTVLSGMNLVSSTVALAALPFVALPRPEVWPVLALSVALHFSYMVALPILYRHADIGQAYPLARGLTPLFATIIAYTTLQEVVTREQALAIACICLGLLVINWNIGVFRISISLLGVAMLVGLLVAAYSVVDAYGTRLNGDWLGFTVWLVLLTALVLLPYATYVNGLSMWATLARASRRTLISGMLGVGAFGVFMWALSLGAVGPVTALRETSILFTTLLGAFLLKEKLSIPRFFGALTIMVGVALFAAVPSS